MSRVWGRHAPTRSHRKCRRIEEVKSRWNTTFSRIENLWPRDGSCPLPLRSKRIFNKCFRIVKTQKISREFRCSCMLIAVCSERSSYPCLCSGVGWKAGITFGRLMKFSRYVSHKEKYRPSSAAMDFVGVNRRQNESGVLRGGKSFHGEQTLTVSHFIADSVGFVTESIMVCKARQDGFAKFIVIKR